MDNNVSVNKNIPQRPLTLEPRIHKKVESFLNSEQDIFNLVDGMGSPLNLIFPQIIEENIAAFKDVYKKHHVRGHIYFTTKPNKSAAIVKQAALQDVGVDVSSEDALKMAMGCGFNASRVECTGPKNSAYLTLAIQHNVKINVDNFDELNQIIDIRSALGIVEKTKVFIRLSGFTSPRLKFTAQDGTFGISVEHINEVFTVLLKHKDVLDFQGFSFHFNAQSPEQKLIAIETLLKYTVEATKKGLTPKGINIGGGFDICYAKDKAEWLNYVDTLKNSLRTYDESLNWNNSGLGFRNEGGVIKGASNFMSHYVDPAGADDLDFYLSSPLAGFDNMSFAQILNDCLFELYIEPGRSLLDQLGVTIGRVNFVKKSTHGETLVGLDMNRNNMHSTHQKLLTDPIVLSRNKSERSACPDGVYYIGNLCLSYDMITYNKTFPDYLPESGDLVIFINTAPYIMDFVESTTLHQRVAKKIAVLESEAGFNWFDDETYNPVSFNLRKDAKA
jgi:diaminopimelate decarboxylase